MPKKLEPRAGLDNRHSVSYAVTAGGRTYTLHLIQNRGLLATDFNLVSYSKEGELLVEHSHVRRDCYYQGWVEGVPRSNVVLSVCSGLRGFVQTDTFTYGIEPAEFSSTFQHLIYKLSDVGNEPTRCFTIRPNMANLEDLYRTIHQHKNRLNVRRRSFVEIHGILDNDLYKFDGNNATASTENILYILNLANGMFKPLDVHLVLNSFEIWTEKNIVYYLIDIVAYSKSFAEWQMENVRPRTKADLVMLFRLNHINGAAGTAYLGQACNKPTASVMVVRWPKPRTLVQMAQTLAHEIGHSLGMEHDTMDFSCPCEQWCCVMYYAGNDGIVSFSGCSRAYYEDFMADGRGACLLNIPPLESYYTHPYCGNKLVEGNEKCDCGSKNECANDPCCDINCKLKAGAQCGFGACCEGCQFVKKGTPCRKPATECDLAEYCNGETNICPENAIAQDGTPCNDGQSVCVANTCYDYNKHCRHLFGPSSTVAPKDCFSLVNTVGDRFGNCGFLDDSVTPIKCEESNIMCGRLQCQNLKKLRIYGTHAATIQTKLGNISCFGVDNHYSLDLPDIAEVGSGAACEPGKVCLKRECVDVSKLNYDCDTEKSCSGHGVCNNKKHCHCDRGWAPPNCKSIGFGGSIDSGPLIEGSFLDYFPEEKTVLGIEAPESAGGPKVECTCFIISAVIAGVTLIVSVLT